MVDYDSHADSFGGNDDLKLTAMPYAALDGLFDGVRIGDSRYGMSLGERYEETVLVDGALYQRKDDPEKLKLYSWRDLGFEPGDDEFNPVEFKRKNENYGGTNYNYQMVAARIDDTGETWTTEEFPTNDDEFPVIGSIIIWNGGNENSGPSSTAKTAARTLTNLGRGAVVDEDDVYNWLNDDAETRDNLEGRRIRRFKIEREGEEYSFYTPVYLDVKTENRIGIPNDGESAIEEAAADTGNAEGAQRAENRAGDNAPASDPDPSTAADGGAEAAQAQQFPAAIDDCIDYCVEQGITEREDVLGTFNVMANNPESSVSLEMVEDAGEDNIMTAIQTRAE